ncbi:uncharacterized protein [Parasteatoda tepidariorum]|nr:uncharacterized protein LOC107451189 isoform X1 [Parasteatoda tepidariorum]XP_042895388.1 uncharacterized protein LOC107451189 isoform X2 [Parasteatoda tepidariorum]XP_042895389.1 uncharacterized protein LOC107451189 isoform X3 [Parasteatoda tepidariorum]
MASLRKLLLLCGFVASTVAVPVSQKSQCARYCSDESDFQLTPGSTYTYDYETTAVTTVQGATQDKTQLQLTAHADIEVLSKCELSLRLRGVQLKLSDPDSPDYLVSLRGIREFGRSLEKHILRFSFQNGQVEHVCPLENVPAWITNIQKGVLSAFQTYILKPDWNALIHETDILGKCSAQYHSLGRSWQGMHTVRKTKDLSSCTERENVDTYLQGTPYATDFQSKSLPVVKGHQECEQVIGNGFLQTSSCNEKLVFRPFSSKGNGVVTTVTQKLIYSVTTTRSFTGNDYRPTTEPLLYQHKQPVIDAAKVNQDSETALKELCDASKEDITISVPRKFSAFVYKLKKLSLSALKALHQKTEKICPDNSKARKFFMDAIPLVNSVDSAHFIYEMISSKQVSESESKVWLTSLSFLNDATPEIIATYTPLLDGKFDQALLGVSSFIHNFCSSKDCSTIPQVRAAVNKLVENLGENCFSGDEKTIILSLKAIGNIGHLFGRENILQACYKNPQIRTETRLAAIEAFRRVNCEVNREDLLKTYSNYNEDTEIRIAAYLAVMRCPSTSVIDDIKGVLMNEKINHVGSFIWTHLNALAKSKHPERQDIRQIISNLYLMNKFESDSRKFSTAHEATYFLESIDSGLHLDSHLIYSTDSYLPRSAMFNLTVDVFGKTCNLLELDGRLEGLEHVVESFFGPSGYFPQKHVAKILREKRSLNQNKLNQIESKYNENARPAQQPYGSLDIKVFGTSMWYNQYRHDDEARTEINLLDIVSNLAEEHEKEYSRSFMFLDTTFTIPMTSGMPLKIAVNGTASVGLKVGGKFDVKSFKHVDVLGHFEPSGAVEIASLLTIDAGNIARSGLRVVSSMHSSSVLDGKVEVKNGEVVKVQLNMPRERIDVFNIESKVYLVHGMEEREKTAEKKSGTQIESCTGKRFSEIFGVKFCSEIEIPPYRANTPLHPLNGPARFNLFIEKTDPTLKSYNFDASWKTELKNGAFIKHGVLSFNTPNSRIDRAVKMEMNLNQEDYTASLKLQSPMKKIGLNGKLVNENFQKKLDFSVAMDDKEYFSLQSDLRIAEEKNGVSYTPFFEMKIPSQKLVSVTGNMQFKYGQKYTAQIQVEDLTAKPILAKANVELGKKDRYDLEVSLSSFALDGTVKGYAQLGNSMSSRITADYRIMESKMNKLSIVGKMRNLSANALMKYQGQLNIQASVLPEWNTELQFESMKTTSHIENSLTLSLGDGARSRIHTIKMQEILRYEGDLSNNKVDASLSLSYPEKRINYGISMNHENSANALKNSLQLQYDTKKAIKTEINLKKNLDGPLNLAGEIKMKYPGRETALQAELTESSSNEYRGTLFCQWQEGKQVGAVVQYKNKSSKGRFKHEVSGNLNLPNYPQITYSSVIGQEQNKFNGFLEANIGTNKYSLKSDLFVGNGLNQRLASQVIVKNEIYTLDATVSHLKSKLNGNIELKMPNRHRVYAKLEGKIADSLKFGSFETYWDADRDTSKRFVFNGELRDQNEGYEGKFNMQVLRRSIKGFFNTGLQGTLFSSKWKSNNKFSVEWSTRDKIAVTLSTNVLLDRSRQQINNHMELITPFNGYENLTLSVTHLYANQQWDSEIATLVPYGNDLSLSSSGKYTFTRGISTVEALGKIQTSYSGYEEMYVTVSHNQNMNELKNKAEVKWSTDKRIQLQLTGAKQSSMFKGTALLSSPFSNFKEMSAEVTNIYTSNNYRTKAEFKWAPTKKVSINFDGSHELNGRRRICTVNMECSTPVRGYENTAMKITYSNDGVTVNTDTETSWNKNKVSTSLSVTLRNQRYEKNIEGKFLLTSPFRNYENVQITSSLDTNRNSYKFNIDGQLPHRSTASFNSQGKMTSLNDLEINAVAIGQFPKIMNNQRISFDLVHKLQNSKLRSTLDTSINNDRLTVLLIGLSEANYNSRNMEFSATLNTPFVNFEEMKADFTHNQRGQEYFTKLQMNKNSLSGSLSHKLVLRDIWNFDSALEATSSITGLNGKFSVVHASNGRQLEHNSFILWDNDKKIQLNAQYIDKTFLKEIVIKFTTPFRKLRDLELKSTYEKQEWDHKGVFSAVWDRRNKMTLSGNLNNFRWESVNAQVEFLSSFKGFEFYSTAVKYDFTAPQKEIEASVQWGNNNRKSIVFNGNFLNSYRLISSTMTLTTPFADYEKISFTKEYSFNNVERNLNVLYERGWRKVVLKGKTIFRTTSAELSFELDSPYEPVKDISASAKYYSLSKGKKAELALQLGRNNNYETMLQYELQGKSISGRMTVKTPFENYENVNAMVSGSYADNKARSELNFAWGNNQKVGAKCNMRFAREDGYLVLTVESPIKNYETVTFNSRYENKRDSAVAEVKVETNGEQAYFGKVDAKYGGEHSAKIQLNFNSPHSPFKNVQWIATIDSNPDLYQFLSTLKWEEKEADVQLLLNKRLGQFYEAKMKLNTPFEGYRTLSFDSSLRSDKNQFMDGRLIVVTPFKILRNLDVYAEYKNDDSGYFAVLKVDTPVTLKVEGKMTNSQFKPLLASLNIEAPFMSFKNIESSAEINFNDLSNMQIALSGKSLNSVHEIVITSMKENGLLNFEAKAESSFLPSKTALLSIKFNDDDASKISGELSIDALGKAHYLSGQFKSSRTYEVLVEADSYLLPEGKAQLKGLLNRRRNDRNIDASVSLTLPSGSHTLSSKYENKGNQLTASFKVNSDIFTMESEAKYINNNGRDVEGRLTISVYDVDHVFVANLRNYEEEKYIQVKADCPAADFLNSLIITGTLKQGDSSDVSLSVSTLNKEVRIAGNMKRIGWENIEGFLTINTPFEGFTMFRLDGRLQNDRFENIDCSFQMESSNRIVPSLGITSKYISTRGSEEMSVMLKLPIRNYQNIQLLGNVHYNPDYSSSDSRLTLSIPRHKFSIYSQYGIGRSRISGRGEIEMDNTKWTASGRLEHSDSKKDVVLTVVTPRSDSYTFGGAYGSSDNQKQISVIYSSPRNQRYNLNTSIAYESLYNFKVEFQAETPYYSYRNIQGIISHQTNSQGVLILSQYVTDDYKDFFKVHHRYQRDGVRGVIQLSIPRTNLQDVKISYGRVKKYTNTEDTLEVDYNRAKQMKMEVILFGAKSSHFVLDIKPFDLTISADRKQIINGQEIVFKSSRLARVVSFRTSHQRDNRQFLHDAAFSWDEKSDKRISYDFRLADTDTGKELWSRLDTPVRSLMLKGNFTQTSRAKSGGVDFYWDAARSLEKHMGVGLMHTDLSSSKQTSHRVQIVVDHPKLNKDIVQTNVVTMGPGEFYVKSELDYSRERHHNLLLELRANDLSKNSRDSHYKAEFNLKHPMSRTDIRSSAEVMDSKLESSANLIMYTLDTKLAQTVREVRAKIMKLRQEIDLTMISNSDKTSISGKMTGRNGDLDMMLERMRNDVKDLAANVKYSRRNNAMDLSVMNNENTGLQMSASFPGESVNLKISHSKNGNVITDADMYIGLEQSKILKSRAIWRPRLMRELRIATGETIRAVGRSSSERYNSLSSTLNEEWSARANLISRSVSELMSPFLNDLKNGLKEIENDFKITNNAFWTMYNRNEFCMKDIVVGYQNLEKFMTELMGGLALGCETMYYMAVEQLEEIYYTIQYSLMDLNEYMSEVFTRMHRSACNAMKSLKHCARECTKNALRRIGEWMQVTNRKFKVLCDKMYLRVDKWIRSYAPCIIDGYYYTKQAADKIRYTVNGIASAATNCIVSNRFYRAVMSYSNSVMTTIQAFQDFNYAESAQAFIDRYYDMQLMDTIINHPTVEYMSGVANSALRRSVEVYHNLGLDYAVSALAETTADYLKSVAMNSAHEFLADFYRSHAGAKYTFTPERGFISLEFTLPGPRSSLIEVFDFKTYPEYQKMINLNTVLAEHYEDFCIWDYYYKFTKYFTPSFWLPAFRAHALISGNQHFITFDKKSYDFAGKCSYLLARDFVDGNFTAVVNYGTSDHMRRSLTILADGRKIDIGNDYKVTLDDVKAECPIQVGHTVVMREGPNVRVDNEKKGFSIVCNFVRNYCSVSVSGFYFGKTAGLFGTFNYEPQLDWMTPGRHFVDDVETFANTWEVGQGACKSTENFATLPTNDYRVQEKCKALFQKSTSEFRACFKQVEPEPYMKMCITDLAAVADTEQDDVICETAAAYFAECKSEGVLLKMPKHCVWCEKQDGGFMNEGDAIQYPRDGSVTAADVVFLIEEKECNKERVKYISKLAQGIENSYKQKGYKDIRFRVVGFGGDKIHSEPHVHTMDGMESGPLRSLDSALNSLEFGDGPINMLQAMRYAASLSYRTGSTKSFILVKCSLCKSEEVKAEYGEMLRTLLDSDITLHLLMEQRYEMKSPTKSSKAKRVIGVDSKFAYTLREVKDSHVPGDVDLLAQLKIPKDVCIPLALEVNGSTFDSQFLTETKRNANKKFMDIFSRLVARSSVESNSNWGMCCECLATEYGVGKSTCQRCVSAEMASMISTDLSGVNNWQASRAQERVRKHKRRGL